MVLPAIIYNMIDFKYYYNGYKTLTHNALYNFIIGNRGGGKSFWAKYWAINDFLKNGSEFIYLRRYSKELKTIKNFFNDVAEFFPNVIFQVKGRTFLINEQKAGECLILATSKIEKSNSYPLVNKIIFDEFIIDKGVYRYLPNEVEYFLELYETVARTREVKTFFLANAITQTNPYFLYFNIELPYNKTVQTFYNNGSGSFVKKKNKENADVLIELVANADYIKMKNKTRFGQLITGTNYSAYAVENTFLRDSETFIQKKGINARYSFKLIYKDSVLGVWVDYTEGYYILSDDIDPKTKTSYAMTTPQHNPNTLLVTNIGKNILLKSFFDAFKQGNVRFESINLKNVFYELLKIVNL